MRHAVAECKWDVSKVVLPISITGRYGFKLTRAGCHPMTAQIVLASPSEKILAPTSWVARAVKSLELNVALAQSELRALQEVLDAA